MAIVDADFAMGDQGIVGVDAQRVMLGRIELDDGSAAHAQKMVDGHDGRAKLHRDINFNLVESVHI